MQQSRHNEIANGPRERHATDEIVGVSNNSQAMAGNVSSTGYSRRTIASTTRCIS